MIRISFTLVLLLLSVPAFAQDQNDRTSDRATITQLENQWLHAKDAATLERILGPDFVHVIAADHFLTKQEQIDWFGKHPQPARCGSTAMWRLSTALSSLLTVAERNWNVPCSPTSLSCETGAGKR
jgi:hypothetical protein